MTVALLCALSVLHQHQVTLNPPDDVILGLQHLVQSAGFADEALALQTGSSHRGILGACGGLMRAEGSQLLMVGIDEPLAAGSR